MKLKQLPLYLLGLAGAACPLAAIDLAVNDKGIEIDAGSTGIFTIAAPELTTTEGATEKPVWEASEKGGQAKYANGAVVDMSITSKEDITVTYSDVPDNAKSLMFHMLIPISLSQGGEVSAEGKDAVLLPEEYAKQHVITGTTVGTLTVADAMGDGFSITMPTNWYTVQDNRQWNWNTFDYQGLIDLKAFPDQKELTITVKDFKRK